MSNRKMFFGNQKVTIPTVDWSNLACTRASIGTYIDNGGTLQTAAINTRRIDYANGYAEMLYESNATNLYLNSAVLVTQNVTIARDYVNVSFVGTGTITFTGAYSGSLVGTGANDRVNLTFSTTPGTLTSTVTGDVRLAQCEEGQNVSFETSYIPTTTSAIKREEELFAFNTISPAISTEFTLLFDMTKYGAYNNTNYNYFRLGSSDSQDYIQFYSAVGRGRIRYSIGGVGVDIQMSNVQYSNIDGPEYRMRLVLVGNGTTIKVFCNGLETNDFTDELPMSITGMSLNKLTNITMTSPDAPWGKYKARYKEIGYQNIALTDLQAKKLTKI